MFAADAKSANFVRVARPASLQQVMMIEKQNAHSDERLLIEMSRGDHAAFAAIFRRYYADLVVFCCQFIGSREVCEDIVQSLFLKLWEMREVVTIDTSLKAYLIRTAQYMCLNELKHSKIKSRYSSEVLSTMPYEIDDRTQDAILYTDLRRLLDHTVESMPDKEREVWIMSRERGLKNNEIAAATGASLRTVELRLAKAKAIVREVIRRHWSTIIILYTFFHGE